MANHLLITLTLSTLLIFSHFTLSKPTTTNEQEDDEEDLSFLEEPELSETSHSTEPDQDFPDFDPFAGDEDDDESFENYEDFEDFEVPEDYDQPQYDNVLTHFDDHDVVVLTEGNFSAVVEGNKYVMVEFYAPWCGHCKALAPEYAAAATEMKGEGDEKEKVVLAKVDAQEESELAERYEVQGFLTVLWFVEGVRKPYLGPHTNIRDETTEGTSSSSAQPTYEDTKATEIALESITPPPNTAKPAEKEKPKTEPASTHVRKELFSSETQDPSEPELKKPKHN